MTTNTLKFAFFGTPNVASETLEILKQNGYIPSLIVTAPDKPQGRKMLITPPLVKTWAIENNIPYIQPEKIIQEQIYDVLRTSSQADEPRKAIFQQENTRGEQNIIDLFIIVAYGKILPENIINMPKLGSINIHYSLLPKYRGASPVESAILNGDKKTGITIQKMEYKMDSGPIIAQEEVKIDDDEKEPILKKRLTKIGAELLVKILNTTPSGDSPLSGGDLMPQDESRATYCKKIKKEDGLVDLITNLPNELYNKFRAYHKWPRTFFFQNNKRIIITDAILKDGKFIIKKIIPESGKEQDYKE